MSEIQDVCEGKEIMEMKTQEKYLGDIISQDGRNNKNIEARIRKGAGIIEKIMTVLEGIPFGKFYFETAMILRNSLLISSILVNSEAWYNLTNTEIRLLETVDVKLLQRTISSLPFFSLHLLHHTNLHLTIFQPNQI